MSLNVTLYVKKIHLRLFLWSFLLFSSEIYSIFGNSLRLSPNPTKPTKNHIIQTHSFPISNSQSTRENYFTSHHKPLTKLPTPTRIQNKMLYKNNFANNQYNNYDKFKKRTHERTTATALDMSKEFDTVHLHKLLQKITHIKMPNTIIKFLSNYIRGRK